MTKKALRVAGLMTAPRHEITWARTHIQKALSGLNIPLTVSGGVFYGQCMQRMLTQLLETEATHALTVDFDSVFTTDDVRRLLNVIAQLDDVDALAAIQPKRGSGTILGSVGQASTFEWDGLPIQVRTAHFGLTVIDLEKLRCTPKPWFIAVADENGDFEDGHIDDDVHFWKQWERAGNTVAIDPGVRLGHLEEMVTMYDENMQKIHLYPKQWTEMIERGNPVESATA